LVFLIAVILSTWLGGTKPGLLAAALALLGFNYVLLRQGALPADDPAQLMREVLFGVVACYVIWITATERGAAESLRRAHSELQRNNDALRAENSERQRIEEELRVSEAKFRALSQSAPERAASGGRLGLLGMKEHVELLGGSLEIDSRPVVEPISASPCPWTQQSRCRRSGRHNNQARASA
jgi:PAS domain-containing protein